MNTFYNYLIPDERQTWRSASEITIAELKHEKRRIQMEAEEIPVVVTAVETKGSLKEGLIAVIMAPLRMLSSLVE